MSLHQDPTQTAVRRQKRSLWTDAWRRMRRSHTAVSLPYCRHRPSPYGH